MLVKSRMRVRLKALEKARTRVRLKAPEKSRTRARLKAEALKGRPLKGLSRNALSRCWSLCSKTRTAPRMMRLGPNRTRIMNAPSCCWPEDSILRSLH